MYEYKQGPGLDDDVCSAVQGIFDAVVQGKLPIGRIGDRFNCVLKDGRTVRILVTVAAPGADMEHTTSHQLEEFPGKH